MKSIIEITVRNEHLDRFGHVNNARYLEFLEDGRWTYSEENGLAALFQKRGIGHVAVNININYRKSAIAGDCLIIETEIAQKSQKSVTMIQKVFKKDSSTLIADALVTNVFLEQNTKKVITTAELSTFWPDLSHAADNH